MCTFMPLPFMSIVRSRRLKLETFIENQIEGKPKQSPVVLSTALISPLNSLNYKNDVKTVTLSNDQRN